MPPTNWVHAAERHQQVDVTLAPTARGRATTTGATPRMVESEMMRLGAIVEDLLWLARFDAEPPPPGDEPVDVAAIAATCADRFSGVAQRAGDCARGAGDARCSNMDQRPARMD